MKKKLLGFLVISMLLLLAIQPAFAGSRTYSHGMEDYRCMGSISSTTTESSMRIKMSVSFLMGELVGFTMKATSTSHSSNCAHLV